MTELFIVTEVPPAGDRGNLASAVGSLWWDPQGDGGNWDDPPVPLHEKLGPGVVYIQTPLWTVGEILVLDEHGRDQFGRKPSKWDVKIEAVPNADMLAAYVRLLTEEQPDEDS